MGLGVAEAALSRGARVTIASRSQDRLDGANKQLGGRAKTIAFDAGDDDAAPKAYASLGPIDHLVTTAAALSYGPIGDASLEDIESMLAGKFWTPVLAAKYAAPLMSGGGSITFFSGLAAYRPGPGMAVVAALNAGLEGLTKALAVELAPLRVNAISPGVVETPGWDFLTEADRNAFFAAQAQTLPSRCRDTVRYRRSDIDTHVKSLCQRNRPSRGWWWQAGLRQDCGTFSRYAPMLPPSTSCTSTEGAVIADQVKR